MSEPDHTTGFTPQQIEALYLDAAREGQVDLLQQFLDAGADPNQVDARGYTPLIIASYNGHADATALLLQRGASPDLADDKGSTALSGVAFKGDQAIAALLLLHGASVDKPNNVGRTPLMFAVMFNREVVARLLLAHGADPFRRDGENNSARSLAERQGNDALARHIDSLAPPATR